MELLQQYQKISRALKPGVKLRVRKIAPLFAEQSRFLQTADSLSRAAYTSLKPLFPAASRQEMDVLAFYLVGLVAAAKGDTVKEAVKDKLDSLSEMGEMESLRLQMAMDRLSKFMSTLSNLLKKTSETSSGITQNIK